MTEKICPPEVKGILETQKNFENYQNRAFPKREAQFFALELAGECGELANCEKKIWRDPAQTIDFEKISDEAADVFIALMNYCNTRGIELENAVRTKLDKIENRRLAGKMGKTK